MNAITAQYLIAAIGIVLGLAGVVLPDEKNMLKPKGDYGKHMSESERAKLARMFGGAMLAAGLLIAFATMAFGDLELF
jgi:hypothetical protein